MSLSPKQEQFCREYLIDLNATQAAIRAGYSARSADVTASRLLGNAKVQENIARLKLARAERVEVTADAVIREMARIAFAPYRKFIRIGSDGDPFIDLREATPEDLDLIESIQCEDYLDGRGEDARTVRKVKIKMYDRQKALDGLARHLGLFIDRREISGPGGGPIETKERPNLTRLSTDRLRQLAAILTDADDESPHAG